MTASDSRSTNYCLLVGTIWGGKARARADLHKHHPIVYLQTPTTHYLFLVSALCD